MTPLGVWLAAVPGLPAKAAQRAYALFERHNIDTAFLDFLISDTGSLILGEYLRLGEYEKRPLLAAPAAVAKAVAPPAGAAVDSASSTQAGADAQAAGRRQRISAADRAQGFYFAHREQPASATACPAVGKGRKGVEEKGSSRSGGAKGSQGVAVPAAATAATAAVKAQAEAHRGPSKPLAQQPPQRPAPAQHSPSLTPKPTSVASSAASMVGGGGYYGGVAAAASASTAAPTALSAPAAPTFQERVLGTLKSYSKEKGYGFLVCSIVAQDVYLRNEDRPADGHCELGRPVSFILAHSAKGQSQARDVEWGELGGDGEGAALGRIYHGVVKSVGEKCGFLVCKEVSTAFNGDVYVPKAHLPAHRPERGELVTFRLSVTSKGQPQARDINWYPDGRSAGPSKAVLCFSASPAASGEEDGEESVIEDLESPKEPGSQPALAARRW